MTKFTRILIAGLGIGIITHAASDAITPPPACPTVTETTTACPTTCTFPICAILSTLTAHCGCPDPAPTVSATFRCAPRDRCLPFPPPCPTLYTVRRITDCAGPTPPPLSSSSSSSYPISSSLTCSTGSSMISSGPLPSSSEPMSSSSTTMSSSALSSSGSVPPLSQSVNTTATATTTTSSITPSAPPVETSTPAEPGTIGSSTVAPSPTVPTSPPSPGPSESRGERRVKTPFWMWWLF